MKLGVVMDPPIHTIQPGHDSTLAMLWEVSKRGWSIFYFEAKDLFLRDGQVYGDARILQVYRDIQRWFSFEGEERLALAELDIILMRKDPPFDQEYLYLTQLLGIAEQSGVLVVNRPRALRDMNEKLAITAFPACCVPMVVSSKIGILKAFYEEEKDVVCKPLQAMGGQSIFRLSSGDANANVIFEVLTQYETCHIMLQRYIPEISQGDKRIILIQGEALPYAVVRIPQGDEWRGNMALGAKPLVQALSARDVQICEQIGPALRAQGVYFAGIDIIGDYLTEINITSPTGIQELDKMAGLNVSAKLFDALRLP